MEAWRCLLRAASAESVPADVYFALGNLHYVWGDLLEFGRRAELGAEGAAKAVVTDINKLRRQAIKKRQLTPASRSKHPARGSPTTTRKDEANRDEGRVVFAATSDKPFPEFDHPEAWEWYMKAAKRG